MDAVTEHYKELCNHLEGELEGMLKGNHLKTEREMRQIITATGRTKDHSDTVLQLLAIGMVWAEDFDGYFVSDRSFEYAVVNVFLKGSSAWQRRTMLRNGKLSSYRRRINRKTREYVARVLIDHVVKHGVTLADRMKRKAESEDRERARIADLIAEAVN